MSKHDFSADEFAARLARTRRAIADAKLDWLLVFHPMSLHWLTGTEAKSYQGFQCLPISADARPLVMFTREGERAELEADALVDEVVSWGGPEPEDPVEAFARLADRLGLRKARVGMEVPAYYLHPHHYVRLKDFFGGALVAEPSTLVLDLKMVKSTRELDYVREATRINDLAIEACFAAVAEGRSELDLTAAAYQALLSAGSGLPASTINLVTGERCAFSHGAPMQRRLRRGDPGNVELGANWKRYTATVGRQFNLGRPTPRMREVHDVVRAACDAQIAEIRTGVPAIVPHEAARRVIAAASFDQYRVHTSGYSLGPGVPPSWVEPLQMFGGSRYTLEAGMVVTVEPPVFIGAEGIGARIIDNVLVTERGCELLSRSTRDLVVID
jgi:Xaa-Pro dipeptidase